jgi:hypothetical protein
MATAMKDMQAMKILDWKRRAQDRSRWKSAVEQARTVASSRNEWISSHTS